MITAITFTFGYNKKFIHPDLKIKGLYSEQTTHDLENIIKRDIDHLNLVNTTVKKLNINLDYPSHVKEILIEVFGEETVARSLRIAYKSLTERVYGIGGLYIHEKD